MVLGSFQPLWIMLSNARLRIIIISYVIMMTPTCKTIREFAALIKMLLFSGYDDDDPTITLEQQTEQQKLLLRQRVFAILLSDDVVVGRQMHIAVDFDNVLELAHRLDDGGVDETKELAKGTDALEGQSVQGPALDEVLADDGVHVLVRKSGLAQVLDANLNGIAKVTEGEKALDVLDAVVQNLSIVEILSRENLDYALLMRCKV